MPKTKAHRKHKSKVSGSYFFTPKHWHNCAPGASSSSKSNSGHSAQPGSSVEHEEEERGGGAGDGEASASGANGANGAQPIGELSRISSFTKECTAAASSCSPHCGLARTGAAPELQQSFMLSKTEVMSEI